LNSPPTASVDTFPILTELEVMPVWSLKALDGIFELLLLPPEPEVVAVDAVVVELHATAVAATTTTNPIAAMRDFHEAAKTPP
jgi:hypothetical protein